MFELAFDCRWRMFEFVYIQDGDLNGIHSMRHLKYGTIEWIQKCGVFISYTLSK